MAETLLGYLGQFEAFAGQGEVLCTHGLGFLLRDTERAAVVTDWINERTVTRAHPVRWQAEWPHDDVGRPDLVGFDRSGRAVMMVEAKLTAALPPGQLGSYATALAKRGAEDPALVVLVPTDRLAAAEAAVWAQLEVSGAAPWLVGDGPVTIATASWEELFDRLAACEDDGHGDLAQLRGLYNAVLGLDVAPAAEDVPAVDRWPQSLLDVVDAATRRLVGDRAVYPMADRGGFLCRYVCRIVEGQEPCFALGLRHPFAGHRTPLWLRYHRDTPIFARIHRRLASAGVQVVHSQGHVWVPLQLPETTGLDACVDDVVAQVVALEDAVWRPANPSAAAPSSSVLGVDDLVEALGHAARLAGSPSPIARYWQQRAEVLNLAFDAPAAIVDPDADLGESGGTAGLRALLARAGQRAATPTTAFSSFVESDEAIAELYQRFKGRVGASLAAQRRLDLDIAIACLEQLAPGIQDRTCPVAVLVDGGIDPTPPDPADAL